MIFYSKSTKNFYDTEINSLENIPVDSVEITSNEYLSLINGRSQGQLISNDEYGFPILIDPPPVSIEIIKNQQKDYINNERDKEELSGFMYLDKMFDSDEVAIRRINTAVLAAQVDNTLVLNWTLKDNTIITLSANQLIQMPLAMAEYANTIHQKAYILKSKIDSSVTINEILSVTWN